MAANKKTTQFPSAATLTGSEIVGLVQNGGNVKGTLTDLFNLFSTLGVVVLMGNYDASVNLFPASGVLKGQLWRISVAGTLGGVEVGPGAKIMALTNAPGQILTNWDITF